MFVANKLDPRSVALFAPSPPAKALAQDMYQALWSCVICVTVTVLVTLVTKSRPDEELKGLVYSLTEVQQEGRAGLIRRPAFWAAVVLAIFLVLQIVFW